MIALTDQPFDPGVLLSAFCKDRTETGAVATFTGLARAEQGATTTLELEAYPGFTQAEIGRIADGARDRFTPDDFSNVHRVGQIAPGDAIVFVATAAGHRRAAFEACDFL
ncbi:MAG: molybdenum cofactor biosynthesis protein MoaE, partial [Phenylobacterium sp.]|nr:molybdenum cofactor biosynthesis protein MoaE [Phenylobacterium sp.]